MLRPKSKKPKQKQSNNFISEITATALQLLAQREHAQYELRQKLIQRNYEVEAVLVVLEKLKCESWQSDDRFAENYIVERASRGFGPLRISQELQLRGLSSEFVENKLVSAQIDWSQVLQQVYFKKFKHAQLQNFKDKGKRIRFLQFRGFSLEEIKNQIK
ncbi:MAG: Regulatory protein RecX [uncultured bacterium]|nr:MAG: Regulatory protein RecX [uncultured bacterium]